MKIIAIVLLAILSMCAAKLRRCQRDPGVDGCTIPIDPKVLFEKKFTDACDHHDVCYICHEEDGLERKFCDDLFYAYMLEACNGELFCRSVAWVYLMGVRMFGGFYFDYPTETWCTESWVESCLHMPEP